MGPNPRGCVPSSTNSGAVAAGEISFGPNITGEAYWGDTRSWSIGISIPGTPFTPSWGTGGLSGSIGFGQSMFVGVGTTRTF